MLDGVLARMSKGRVPDVVSEAGGGDNGPDVRRVNAGNLVPLQDVRADGRAERSSNAGGLQAVREAGADVIAFRHGKDLRFVLQPAEGGGEDDPVVVPLKGRTLRLRRLGNVLADAVGA